MQLLPKNDYHRKIIHLDMDAFYASVEMRDNPALKTKALVIGHDPRQNGGHGVVATANYLARQYGVHSAMPASRALRLVPKDLLAFVKPNFDKYRQVSQQVHEIMHEVTDQVESVALDEAYMDVTKNKLGDYSAVELGSYMQDKIYQELHLTASFGVSFNKFLAKMGSEYAKPFGRTIILPETSLAFLARQPVDHFPGVGKKTSQILHEAGIETGLDLQKLPVDYFTKNFGKFGYAIYLHAHAIDFSPVKAQRQRKSIGKETTFIPFVFNRNELWQQLKNFAQLICQKLQSQNLTCKVVTLKYRSPDFVTLTKRITLAKRTNDSKIVYQTAVELLELVPYDNGVRLLGLSVSELEHANFEEISLGLFPTDW
ncbi:DNA polymerase IV [Lactobacillus psittaci]|uniref:DNA polymerase IV n=1 Tax=Lactobacillus psittaci DSM 15354 TaxID=1122152 RepID=A0A0R1S6C2_9LACO|nr:DNA polymerase IV [Lactobacillus psittaci]KRL63060.1 nucleotidyltransferase DNA polymerase for DNA repair [Lactobacillus psittaci DSM 15354]